MSIFREPFKAEIQNQLSYRQDMLQDFQPSHIQYLNSRNAWVRMTSAVDVNGSSALARQYVLQGGTLQDGAPNVSAPYSGSLRSGIGSGGQSYSTSNFSGNTNRLGIRPMPGITSMDVKSKSAYGSLREITVNFQCWDIRQLEDLELLYMRPGYTALVEWGWAPFINGGVYNSSFTDFYGDDLLIAGPTQRSAIFKELYDRSIKYGGNYDAMYGYIKNYSWKAREDGGYDCQTIIISTGEIIESLKVNYIRDVSKLNMYTPGSIGTGYLDAEFSAQGSTESYIYSDAYNKNILAGIWTELYYKLSDSSVSLGSSGKIASLNNFAYTDLLGLKDLGDTSQLIQPGRGRQIYLPLSAVCETINEYVIIKGGDSGAQNDPLITLSTKYPTYTNSPYSGQPLLCTAHPLQISTDPSSCIIENEMWEKDILPAAKAAVSGALAPLAKQAGDILLILETESYIFPPSSKSTNVTYTTKIRNALLKVNSIALYNIIDETIRNGGQYTTTLGRTFTFGGKYSDGLAGYLQDVLIDNVDKTVELSSTALAIVTPPLSAVNRLNVKKNRTILGMGGGTSSGYKAPSSGYTPKGYQPYKSLWAYSNLRDIVKHFRSIKIDFDATVNGMGAAYSSFKISTTTREYGEDIPHFLKEYIIVKGSLSSATLYYWWEIDEQAYSLGTITGPKSTNANVTSIIFNVDDAVETMKKINNGINLPYFYNNDPSTELGVIENIYVNLDFLYRQSLNTNLESQDGKEKNEINLYNYMKSVISAINSALGSVSNLEIHVDPVDNVARIIDVNYTDPDRKPKLFELQVQNAKSVIRSYQLNSQIFPNQSSIIAIGAQGEKGGQMGIQNNTMIDFNKKLKDRIMPIKGEDLTSAGGDPNQPTFGNYLSDIILLLAICNQGSNSSNIASFYSQASNKAKNSLRDSIVYFQNIVYSSAANRNIIPTKFSFEMDGIGGITIGQLFTINQDVLPSGYKGVAAGSLLAQIVTGIGHKISGGDWTTTIDALNIILDTKPGEWSKISKAGLQKIIENAITLLTERYK